MVQSKNTIKSYILDEYNKVLISFALLEFLFLIAVNSNKGSYRLDIKQNICGNQKRLKISKSF